MQALVQPLGAEPHLRDPEANISRLSIDSRKLLDTSEVLFFALSGPNHDGHTFIPALQERGIRNFVVTHLPEQRLENTNFLVVPDTRKALQQLTAWHRQHFDIPVLAVTGSNGKTIVKEWLGWLLADTFRVVKSPRSYNSQIGVPLAVWQMQPYHELALFEAGISKPGEMEHLERILQPTLGLFTNLRDAHSENFESDLQKAREKAQLFESCKRILYCADHALVRQVLAEMHPEKNHLTWGHATDATLQLIEAISENGHSTLQANYRGQPIQLRIPFTDTASLENACLCWLTALELGMPPEEIDQRAWELAPVAMRLERKQGIQRTFLINDVYNTDLHSVEIALEQLNRQHQYPKKTLIISDILQSDLPDEALYTSLNTLVQQAGINRFIGIGPALSRYRELIQIPEARFFESTEDLLRQWPSLDFREEVILLKGARPFELERISQRLEEKTHATRLEVDLSALEHNLNAFRSLLKPDVKLMIMVKAASYGSGSTEIARMLEFHRVDYLGVAYIDEGIELRKAGIQTPIFVMSPEIEGYAAMLEHGLEPELFNERSLESFYELLLRDDPERWPYPVHLKLDTGMKRLGFEAGQLDALVKRLQHMPEMRVRSVFSHLAASDSEEHDAFTRQQIDAFRTMSDQLIDALGYPVDRHMLNSSGIARFPDAQFDMVRLGIGLYGLAPEVNGLQWMPVSSLKSHIVQVKTVQPGESVGYGRMERATQEMRIGTVALGYADGLSRALGNRKSYLLVHGRQAPIVGNVCMDMCMIDLTDIPAEEGDEVLVFGAGRSVRELARTLDTIPYEILTSIPGRVKRLYFHE